MNPTIDLTGVRLETDALVLRPFEAEDLVDFNAYASVPGVGELAGWTHHQSLEESQEILNLFISGKEDFAIVDKQSGKVIGSVGVDKYDEEKVGAEYQTLRCREIGYVLSKDYWGRGYMPEAARAVLSYCFDTVQLDAVFCGYFKRNQQSRRVNEKLGFDYVCDHVLMTRYGTEEDSVLTVMTQEKWATLKDSRA